MYTALNPKTGFYPSKALLDPWARLIVGVVLQAVKDLWSDDPVTQVDALLWLLSCEAPLYLEVAGINTNLLAWLRTGPREIDCITGRFIHE